MQKKHLFLITALVLISLFLTACNLSPTEGIVIDTCSSLTGIKKDNCYFEALTCSKIKDSSIRDSCVAELAKKKNDVKICKLIKSEKIKGYCQELLAELNNNPSACKDIKDTYWKDNCYYNLGLNNNNSKLCFSISDGKQKTECYKKIAYATNNSKICESLGIEGSQPCYYKIAKQTQSIETCKLIKNKLNRNNCIWGRIRAKNDSMLCAQLDHSQIKTKCEELFKK